MTARAKNTHQDKGLVLVLQDLHASAPAQLRSKSSDEAAHDYCWSALVLSAAFGFRVSPGVTTIFTTRRLGGHCPSSLLKSGVGVSRAYSLHGVNCVTI